MTEAVFISDLHLHPAREDIAKRFEAFLQWIAASNTKKLYILGDFFHVWAGDDLMDLWSMGIAMQLRALKNNDIQVYFMAGNRDFLLGARFANYAGWIVLEEPTVIQCGEQPVLLVHGDGYCTKDTDHQRFRRITRNRLFCTIFKHMPKTLRAKLASGARNISQRNTPSKTVDMMDVVKDDVIAHMRAQQVQILIHGHTHTPGLTEYQEKGLALKRYVLSDWDDTPTFLCYDRPHGFYFRQLDRFVAEKENA